jgi:hypothetical protein
MDTGDSQRPAMPEKPPIVPSDAVHCISGLIYQVLRPGTGDERPGPDDVVQVHCRAWNEAAAVCGAPKSGTPQTLSVSEAIPGLAEAFQLMTVGQQIRVWIPARLSSPAVQEAKRGAMVLDLELVDFTRVKPPPSVPLELRSPRKEP